MVSKWRTSSNIEPKTAAEEFFHAYQNDNKYNYGLGEFNREFEAKTYSTFVEYEYGIVSTIESMEKFQYLITNSTYGNNEYIITPINVLSWQFLNDYYVYADKFRIFNVIQEIGNKQYKMRTYPAPYSLQKIVLDTYKFF